jgi:protein gp37
MKKTKIEFCDSTWSPVSGCRYLCPYCYARGTANRFKGCDKNPEGKTDAEVVDLKGREFITCRDGVARVAPYPYGFTPTFHEYRLWDIQRGKFGKTIFVCSTSDLFGDWIPDEWIEKVFSTCLEADDHRYLFLTKNPSRYIDLHNAGKLPKRDNFWYGSTIDNPDAPIFWSDCHHTFVSIEPIMRPFGQAKGAHLESVEWAIIGAETGNRREKVIPEKSWIEPVVDFLLKNKTPVFMKGSMKPVWGDDIITELPWEDRT